MASKGLQRGSEPPTRAQVTRTGEFMLPSSIHRRWATDQALVLDRGGYVILRPVPDSVGSLRGSLGAFGWRSSDDLRRISREDEAEAEARRA